MNPKLFSKILFRNGITNRSYYTNRTRKPTLYSRISPLGSPGVSVVPELEDWVQKGSKVRVAELHRIIHDLRKRKRFTQALEVCDCFIALFWLLISFYFGEWLPFCISFVAQKIREKGRTFSEVSELNFGLYSRENKFLYPLKLMTVYVAMGIINQISFFLKQM